MKSKNIVSFICVIAACSMRQARGDTYALTLVSIVEHAIIESRVEFHCSLVRRWKNHHEFEFQIDKPELAMKRTRIRKLPDSLPEEVRKVYDEKIQNGLIRSVENPELLTDIKGGIIRGKVTEDSWIIVSDSTSANRVFGPTGELLQSVLTSQPSDSGHMKVARQYFTKVDRKSICLGDAGRVDWFTLRRSNEGDIVSYVMRIYRTGERMPIYARFVMNYGMGHDDKDVSGFAPDQGKSDERKPEVVHSRFRQILMVRWLQIGTQPECIRAAIQDFEKTCALKLDGEEPLHVIPGPELSLLDSVGGQAE